MRPTGKRWTVDDMTVREQCCYSRERVAALWGRRKTLSLAQVLALDIPVSDRLWVAHRPGAMTAAQYAQWKNVVLTRCITRHALTCGVLAVEAWAAKWLDGSDRSAAEAAEAAEAARAAWAAEAARAAWAARAAEAAEAAWEAEAAWAAWAAEAAEQQQQLDDLRAILAAK